jgi:putative pyruvate formate lyase activating enzyme
MYRQVGNLVIDGDGVALRGLVIRHLILPNGVAGSEESLAWLSREVSPEVTLSVMSQYYPAHRAMRFPELSRPITPEEYNEVISLLDRLGMENGWLQGMGASGYYLPDFRKQGHPFE